MVLHPSEEEEEEGGEKATLLMGSEWILWKDRMGS